MGKVEKISVSLPADMVKAVNSAVDSGSYATVSEVVREALRKWEHERAESDRLYHQAVKTYGRNRLSAMVQEGIDSLDREGGIPADQVFNRLTTKYEAMAKPQKKPARKRHTRR